MGATQVLVEGVTSAGVPAGVLVAADGTVQVGLVAGSQVIGHVVVDSVASLPAAGTPSALTPAAPATASAGGSSGQAVASNSSRKGLVVVNTDTAKGVYLAFGANAAVVGSGIYLSPGGGGWSMDSQSFTTQAVNAIATSASATLSVQEFS